MRLLEQFKKTSDKGRKDRERYIENNRILYLEEIQELSNHINQLKASENPSTTRLSLLEKRKARVEQLLKHDI